MKKVLLIVGLFLLASCSLNSNSSSESSNSTYLNVGKNLSWNVIKWKKTDFRSEGSWKYTKEQFDEAMKLVEEILKD
jgi:uncharacterized lipoprotein YajG